MAWVPGDVFHPDLFAQTRKMILASGLFQSTTLTLAEQANEKGLWEVKIALSNRPRRTISGGVGYDSDQGVTLQGRWEHHNFFGAAQHLQTRGEFFPSGVRLFAGMDIPHLKHPKRSTRLELGYEHEESPAFVQSTISTGVGIIFPGWYDSQTSLGVRWHSTYLEEASSGEIGKFGLLSLPVQMILDRSDDPLNPQTGWKATLGVTPKTELHGSEMLFTNFFLHSTRYFTPSPSSGWTLAGRGSISWIWDNLGNGIPATELLYAGGSGSVRGFGLQMANELDTSDDPLGGLSKLEFSAEVRKQFNDSLGAALFVDAGRAYSESIPNLDHPFFSSVGTGFRYMTPMGPLRLDVAVPFNRRPQDDRFQIYLGIGQAF
ncbi:MAG: BamA/TamA family outer membrane protein [Magnetococcales bacterium]|nr:BamA/TamA family outer membrane protein [Magnetococcales bacterium]